MKDYQIKLLKTTKGNYFKLNTYQIIHRKFDGSLTGNLTREALITKNSVGALLYDPDKKKIALIEQFRMAPSAQQEIFKPSKPENPWVYEIVAGTMANDESIQSTLIREVKEESHLEVLDSEYIGSYYLCPGYSSEKMHVFCVKVNLDDYQPLAGLATEGEDIKIHLFDYDQIKQLTKKVNIFPTLALLQWFIIHKLS